jgi:hypothetical protein
LLIITGPPWTPENDKDFSEIWKNFTGTKIISGGTTAKILGRELNLAIRTKDNDDNYGFPSEMEMQGADMVTEGILTLAAFAKSLENGPDSLSLEQTSSDKKNKTVARLKKYFLNCDRIHFVVGTKINDANYDPAMPIELEARRSLIRRIANILETKYIKQVDIRFF